MSTFTLNHKTYDLTKYPSVFKLWVILAFDSVTMNATTEPIIEFCDKTGWNPTMATNYIYGRASTVAPIQLVVDLVWMLIHHVN